MYESAILCLLLIAESVARKRNIIIRPNFEYKLYLITDAPKLINSDLFLEKRDTVPIKLEILYVGFCSTFPTNKLLLSSSGAPVI